ncbi:MAG TPA: carboxypeptidase regulatory-like domain-containing protein [Vicinamibacterales bacterium]|nr:carboxypeptidase regulatory-like domain-containing protein [Vicinamibacterales bacterium]
MIRKSLFTISLAFSAAVLLVAQSGPALTGIVSSPAEGAMEGVIVSAKRAGGTMTVSVLSDAQGRYAFPASRLEPGTYAIRVRAAGYDLEGPSTVDIAAGRATQLDLKLRKTQDLAAQLTNGEWFMSWPGTTEMKNGLLNCTQCHTLERVARSKHNAEEWAKVLERMGRYAQGSTPERPQLRPNEHGGGRSNPILQQSMGGREGEDPVMKDRVGAAAAYLASINLSEGRTTWTYPLKTYPRPTGKATRVIITEYDLPRKEALPHDAAADSQGNVWYGDFGTNMLGMLDPKTGKVTEYPLPMTKPGAPQGSLDLVLDKQENIWMGTMYQGSLAKFDRATKRFQTWGSPTFKDRDEARIAMVMPINSDVDGQVWIGGDNEYQVDVKTGEWKTVDYGVGLEDKALVKELSSYGVSSDSKNNFYGMNLNGTYIIRIDGKTKKVTPFATPTPNAGPRRGHMDAQDRLWFAEFRGNKIGMFDTRTETFQEFAVPTPWTNVYDAISDRAGFAWAGGMNNDHVVRVNTKTGEVVEYLLPRMTNIRRVNVDNGSNPPAFWVGNNLGASLVRVEPVE